MMIVALQLVVSEKREKRKMPMDRMDSKTTLREVDHYDQQDWTLLRNHSSLSILPRGVKP